MKCNVFDYCRFATHEGLTCTVFPSVCAYLYPSIYLRAESLADRARVAEARRLAEINYPCSLRNMCGSYDELKCSPSFRDACRDKERMGDRV